MWTWLHSGEQFLSHNDKHSWKCCDLTRIAFTPYGVSTRLHPPRSNFYPSSPSVMHVRGGKQTQVQCWLLQDKIELWIVQQCQDWIIGTIHQCGNDKKPRCKEHLLLNSLLFSSSHTALMENAEKHKLPHSLPFCLWTIVLGQHGTHTA